MYVCSSYKLYICVWIFLEPLSLAACVSVCACVCDWGREWPCCITPISLVESISANWIKVKCSMTERESKWTVSVITAYLILSLTHAHTTYTCMHTHTRMHTHTAHREQVCTLSISIKGNWKWVSDWTEWQLLNCNTEFSTNLHFCQSPTFISQRYFTHFSSKVFQ